MDSIADGEAVARGSVARHLARVARLRPGERVEVSDQARAYVAVAETCSRHEVRFRVQEALPAPEVTPRLEAALAIIRFNRFEWAVEKLTELGVHQIIPTVAARSDSHLVAAAPSRLDRWRRIAFEAAQQSRRLAAPSVEAPSTLGEVIDGGAGGSTTLMADPVGRPLLQVHSGEATRFLVGPEGGWTEAEQRLASQSGCTSASLGANVLRTETAAVAMAAVCANSSRRES